MRLLFIFGNSPDLARLEVISVLNRYKVPFREIAYRAPTFEIETNNNLSPEIFSLLGGTVKVAEVAGILDGKSDLSLRITKFLREKGQPKIDFGFSAYSFDIRDLIPYLKEIKSNLTSEGVKTR